MIALALGLALQTSAARSLVVRDNQRSVRVATVSSANGPLVSTTALAKLIPLRITHDSANWYTLEAWGGRVEVEVGTPMVKIRDDVRPMNGAAVMRNGTLMLPLQFVSDVFPRALPNVRWDADSAQLVLFTPMLAASAGPGPNAPLVRQSGEPLTRVSTTSSSRGGTLPPPPPKTGRRTIIVDAGHGGVDNGMTGPLGGGPRIYEKNITLAVAMRLGEQLKARGVDVVYTRTTDTLIALDDRGKIANRAQGDLFISIHVNAANPNWKDPGGSRGFETYFLSEARTEDARRVEHMENDATRFETGTTQIDKNDPLGFILSDMQQNEHLRESSELADLIQRSVGKVHPGPSRGVKQAGFRVLVTAYMPAVLVEIGFGTNPREAQYIADPDKQAVLATAIADAAMEYLNRYEDRVRGSRAGGSQR
jgi:N-acetylmuramoyl-L-alanine amidase